MQPNSQSIMNGLHQAMKTEADGYHFYLMVAEKTQDDKGRKVFLTLAQEELDHLKFLKAQLESYRSSARPDPTATLGPRAEFAEENPIFSDNLRNRIAQAHFEMSALSIGIQLELNSERYYRLQAEKATDVAAQSFFRQLADWESGHYRALLQQQEALKEEYWAAGGFAPF